MQWYCNNAVILHLVTKPVKTSDLRSAHVLESEERIIRAAHKLFVKHGYRATTLSAVADAAGVAHRTVYVRFGTKGALLKRVIDLAVVGDLAPVAVVGRAWFRTATSAPTLDERIAALASGGAQLVTSAADVIAVSREAESTEPVLAEFAAAGRAATREAFRDFWRQAVDDGLLPATTALAWLADTSSLLGHVETYLLMRQMQPDVAADYEAWLAATCRRLAVAAGGRER